MKKFVRKSTLLLKRKLFLVFSNLPIFFNKIKFYYQKLVSFFLEFLRISSVGFKAVKDFICWVSPMIHDFSHFVRRAIMVRLEESKQLVIAHFKRYNFFVPPKDKWVRRGAYKIYVMLKAKFEHYVYGYKDDTGFSNSFSEEEAKRFEVYRYYLEEQEEDTIGGVSPEEFKRRARQLKREQETSAYEAELLERKEKALRGQPSIMVNLYPTKIITPEDYKPLVSQKIGGPAPFWLDRTSWRLFFSKKLKLKIFRPKSPSQEIPKSPSQEIPKSPSQEIPKSPSQEIPKSPSQEIPFTKLNFSGVPYPKERAYFREDLSEFFGPDAKKFAAARKAKVIKARDIHTIDHYDALHFFGRPCPRPIWEYTLEGLYSVLAYYKWHVWDNNIAIILKRSTETHPFFAHVISLFLFPTMLFRAIFIDFIYYYPYTWMVAYYLRYTMLDARDTCASSYDIYGRRVVTDLVKDRHAIYPFHYILCLIRGEMSLSFFDRAYFSVHPMARFASFELFHRKPPFRWNFFIAPDIMLRNVTHRVFLTTFFWSFVIHLLVIRRGYIVETFKLIFLSQWDALWFTLDYVGTHYLFPFSGPIDDFLYKVRARLQFYHGIYTILDLRLRRAKMRVNYEWYPSVRYIMPRNAKYEKSKHKNFRWKSFQRERFRNLEYPGPKTSLFFNFWNDIYHSMPGEDEFFPWWFTPKRVSKDKAFYSGPLGRFRKWIDSMDWVNFWYQSRRSFLLIYDHLYYTTDRQHAPKKRFTSAFRRTWWEAFRDFMLWDYTRYSEWEYLFELEELEPWARLGEVIGFCLFSFYCVTRGVLVICFAPLFTLWVLLDSRLKLTYTAVRVTATIFYRVYFSIAWLGELEWEFNTPWGIYLRDIRRSNPSIEELDECDGEDSSNDEDAFKPFHGIYGFGAYYFFYFYWFVYYGVYMSFIFYVIRPFKEKLWAPYLDPYVYRPLATKHVPWFMSNIYMPIWEFFWLWFRVFLGYPLAFGLLLVIRFYLWTFYYMWCFFKQNIFLYVYYWVIWRWSRRFYKRDILDAGINCARELDERFLWSEFEMEEEGTEIESTGISSSVDEWALWPQHEYKDPVTEVTDPYRPDKGSAFASGDDRKEVYLFTGFWGMFGEGRVGNLKNKGVWNPLKSDYNFFSYYFFVVPVSTVLNLVSRFFGGFVYYTVNYCFNYRFFSLIIIVLGIYFFFDPSRFANWATFDRSPPFLLWYLYPYPILGQTMGVILVHFLLTTMRFFSDRFDISYHEWNDFYYCNLIFFYVYCLIEIEWATPARWWWGLGSNMFPYHGWFMGI